MIQIPRVAFAHLIAGLAGLACQAAVHAQTVVDESRAALDERRFSILRRAFAISGAPNVSGMKLRNVSVSSRNYICGQASIPGRFGGMKPFMPFAVAPDGRLTLDDPQARDHAIQNIKIGTLCKR